MTLYKGCPGAKRIKEPYPEEVKCACGGVAEIWSDETNAVCKHCGRKITRELLPSCLDWCSLARECIGEKKFKDYLQAKQWKSEH